MDTMRLFTAEIDAAVNHNVFHGDPMNALSKYVAALGDDVALDLEIDPLELD